MKIRSLFPVFIAAICLVAAYPLFASTWAAWNGIPVGTSSGNITRWQGVLIGTSTGKLGAWNGLTSPGSGSPSTYLQGAINPSCGGGSPCTQAFSSNVTNPSTIFVVYANGSPVSASACGQSMTKLADGSSNLFTIYGVHNTTNSSCTVSYTCGAGCYGEMQIIEMSSAGALENPGANNSASNAGPATAGPITLGGANDAVVLGINAPSPSCAGLTHQAAISGTNDIFTGSIASAGSYTPSCTIGYSTTWYMGFGAAQH